MNETKYIAHCIKCKKSISVRRDMLCPECYKDIFNISPYFCFKCKEIYPNKEICPKCNIPLGREEENKE
jgi:rRNA maturation endonuclease Nob1